MKQSLSDDEFTPILPMVDRMTEEQIIALKLAIATRECQRFEVCSLYARHIVPPPKKETPYGYCAICGQKMPEGEEVFRYHGYSCDCPPMPQDQPQEVKA